MFKRTILFLTFLTASSFALAENALWHCAATNQAGAVWHWYGNSQFETKTSAQKACKEQNDGRTCAMVCFPPQVYYRCYAHDTLPSVIKNDQNQASTPKQGTWYWSSYSKQIAINGARDACRHNSPYGGCIVDEKNCASS